MSFFDEPEETRTAPRSAPRRRRPSGGGRRPGPAPQQAILIRRIVLVAAVVIAVILIAVLVNSCETNARNSALKDYNNNVASLNAQSVNTGKSFFTALSGGTGDPTGLQTHINNDLADANSQLSKAKSIDVPDEVKGAQQNFVTALQMRADGIRNIARQVQPALQTQTSQDAVNRIASNMARFYASDVLYVNYSVPEIIGALHAAGISVGGLGGQQINSSQFLPSIDWLNPTNVARQLRVQLPASQRKTATPGLHGHQLNSVSVGGTQLQTGSTNSIPASPAPTFTLNFANTGTNTETNVICKVQVTGAPKVTAQTIVPQTTAGQSTSCQVTLNGVPPKGAQQLVATIVPVLGEKTTSNNTLQFPVTFQ